MASGPTSGTEAPRRGVLPPEQSTAGRTSAAEPPFTDRCSDHNAAGTYVCVACGAPLFLSKSRVDSGSGGPGYCQPVSAEAVSELADDSHGMRSVQAQCAHCHSHLGHVLPEGSGPTGRRYCINPAALEFVPASATGGG